MKKAVIVVGGTQHLVAEGDVIEVNHLTDDKKTVDFKPLMIVDGKNTILDPKKLDTSTVTAKVIDAEIKGEKVIALRYKAKKRVHTKRGHRQTLTRLKIATLS